jgi:hypothetical protein
MVSRSFAFLFASGLFVYVVFKMQSVKNYLQGKALGVAELLTPVLKVTLNVFCVFGVFEWHLILIVSQFNRSNYTTPVSVGF